MEVALGQHSVYRLSFYIIFGKVLSSYSKAWRRRLYKEIITQTTNKYLQCEIEMIGFDKDHIYFIMIIPTKYTLVDVIAKL